LLLGAGLCPDHSQTIRGSEKKEGTGMGRKESQIIKGDGEGKGRGKRGKKRGKKEV